MTGARRKVALPAIMKPLSSRWSATILIAFLVVSAGCSRRPRQLPVGLSLDELPHAGRASLLALTPMPAFVVAAVQDPLASWTALEASDLLKRLRKQRLLDDAMAWPWFERWRVLQERLSELSRQPVPGLRSLLGAPAVFSLTSEGDWLYVAGISHAPALAFASALNGVHPSGREVELERRHGIPMRLVHFGEGQIVYYVLADRLVISDDPVLLGRSLDLLFSDGKQTSAASDPRFSGIELQAERSGLALAVDPHNGSELLRSLGLRGLNAGPDAFSPQFDPARWATPDRGAPPAEAVSPTGARVDMAGLQLVPFWQALRSRLTSASATPSPLLLACDALASGLGRGLWFRLGVRGDDLDFALWLDRPASTGTSDGGPVDDLVGLLLTAPTQSVPLPGDGTLWCAAGGGLCLAECPRLLALTNRGESLSAAGCPLPTAAAVDEPWLAIELRDGSDAGAWVRAAGSPDGGSVRWAGP